LDLIAWFTNVRTEFVPRAWAVIAIVLLTGAVGGLTSGVPASTHIAGVTVKPFIRGLISENGMPPTNYLPWFKSLVINVKWSDLQPVAGGPIVRSGILDRAIASAHQLGLAVKIRFLAGIYAPDWAKNLDGTPVPVTNPSDHTRGTIGRFWTPNYGRAYDDVQLKLAAIYDQVPQVREVTISRCMTFFAEPFIRDATSDATVRALLAAGFTAAADLKCLKGQIDTHAAAWLTTPSGLAFTPYQRIDSTGTVTLDETLTEQMMAYCRQSLAGRCVIENNSISASTKITRVYLAMQGFLAPKSFQAAGPLRLGDVNTMLTIAISVGATSVEVLTSVMPQITNIATVASQLETSCTSANVSPFSSSAPAGVVVTLKASADGCSNPRYQFYVQYPAGIWHLIQPWAGSSVSWNTSGLAPGIYTVHGWANQTGNPTKTWEAYGSGTVTLTG
jgi:hypothetical protein